MDKKTFIKGMAAGVALVLVLNITLGIFTSVFSNIYTRLVPTSASPERKINEIISLLDHYYVDSYDKSVLTESMYEGLVSGIGDPYTSYMDKKTREDFEEKTEGTFAGIGITVSADKEGRLLEVVSPIKGTPSDRAGILPGDKLLKVNGFEVYAANYSDAISMIRGVPGTSVTITLYRESESKTFDLEIVRENIAVPTVDHRMLQDDSGENNIGYIRIENFERVTYDQFVEAYEDLNSQSMKGLVIDLRNNPGGLLDVVCEISDILVPEGNIVFTEDKNGNKKYMESDANQIEVPLTILVNRYSASASEILAGAVKDMKVGSLVGDKTYGKGLVQGLFPLSDGSAVKVTVAKYYTPNGICINGEGIEPDYAVDMADELTYNISSLTLEEDVQLQKAIEVIQNQLD